jgi:hypothetical protein
MQRDMQKRGEELQKQLRDLEKHYSEI